MADQEVVVGELVVSILETGTARNREQEVVAEFTSIKTTDPVPVRETWKVTVSGAVIEAIKDLMQQYTYSLADEGAVKDLIAKNPFEVRVQRTP